VSQCKARTAKGKPCPYKAKEGHLVCGNHLAAQTREKAIKPTESAGDPSVELDPDVRKSILEAIKHGATDTVAAHRSGVDPTQLQAWLEANIDGMRDATDRLRADLEVVCLEAIGLAAKRGEWRAAVWMLEASGRVGGTHSLLGGGAEAEDTPEAAIDAADENAIVDDQLGPDGKPL
jgi:hypothetical protein